MSPPESGRGGLAWTAVSYGPGFSYSGTCELGGTVGSNTYECRVDGRPTAGSDQHAGERRDFTLEYDDSVRTMEWSYGYSVQQDAFGNTIRRGDSEYRVTAMEEVCE